MVDQVFDADDVCVIGVPSYGGRVPGIALERMNKFKGNHKEIANLVANEVGSYQEIDLSKKEDMVDQVFDADDICVIGVPSYGGRVPGFALERMNKFKGNHAKALLVVSY